MSTLKFQKVLNKIHEKIRNYNKLSHYPDLIPHYYTKLIGVLIFSGICIISVNLLHPLIFGEFMVITSISLNYKETLVIRLIGFLSTIIMFYISWSILKVIEDIEKKNKDDSKEKLKSQSEKSKIQLFEKDKDNCPVMDPSLIIEKQDIFTRKISDNDPLWRVRAYIIGFLLADGTIQIKDKKGNYAPTLYIIQHLKDKDIIFNLFNALGGKIDKMVRNDKIYFVLRNYNRNLVLKLKEFGMVERHSLEEVAVNLLPPRFIQKKICKKTLIRDFFRGYFDGDGTFFESIDKLSINFSIIGPTKFLSNLKMFVEKEIPDLTTYILPYKIKTIIIRNKKYRIYGKNRIYLKGKGFVELTINELNTSLIQKEIHPWLSYLYIRGRMNCIKFFNWLYCDDDNFNLFELDGVNLCGQRKFKKVLLAVGKKDIRDEKLAPDWKDILFDIIPLFKSRYYRIKALMELTNEDLFKKLRKSNLEFVYERKKAKDVDNFARRLKILEYTSDLIGSYQKKEGRYNIRYYYSKLNPPSQKDPNFFKDINLQTKDGKLLRNIKNLIIYIFLLDNQWRTFNEIRKSAVKTGFFSQNITKPYNLKLFILELIAFEVLLVDNDKKDITEQQFLLNYSIIPHFYNNSINCLIPQLSEIFHS